MNTDIKATVTKGTMVRHALSGATGIVVGKWLNTWTNQFVYNVKINGLTLSWNALTVQVL